MRRIVVALVLALIAPVAVAAKPTEGQIDRLLELSHTRAQMEGMLDQFSNSQRAMVDQMLAGQTATEEQRAKVHRMMTLMEKRMREAMAWEKVRPVYQRVYVATFEAEDVDAMIAFYSTPSGQRVIERMPALMQNAMLEVQGQMAPVIQQLQLDLAAELMAKDAAGSGAGHVAE